MTSGHSVDLVIGVAGAGKSTTLGAVRAGVEAACYRVLGTATSGHAAKALSDKLTPLHALALEHLRHGHPAGAVGWYTERGRSGQRRLFPTVHQPQLVASKRAS